MSFFRTALKGIGWMGSLRLFTRGFTLIRTVVLARLLTPLEFGIFGIVTLTISLFEILTETGINTVLIQEDANIDSFINTAWLISIFRGIFISVLVAISAYPLTQFFSSSNSASFLLIASLIPLIRGFINPSVVKFQKQLQFQQEFNLRFGVLLTESLIAIVAAFLTHSVISLILALIIGALLEVVLSFVFCLPRPTFSWDKEKAKKIVSRGKWVTLSGIFSYLTDQGDDAVVGKLLGVRSLGLYQMAYKISNLPFTEITNVFSKVTFPIYSKISQNKRRVKEAFRKTFFIIFLLVVPLALIIFFFPEPIIKIILGPKWLEATQALQILAIFGLTRAVSGSIKSILLTFKRQDLAAKINFIKFIFLSFLIIPLTTNFNIKGAAFAVLISSLLIQPLIWKSAKIVLK